MLEGACTLGEGRGVRAAFGASGAPGGAAREGQEEHLERKQRTPSSRAMPSSSPKTTATISPPVRPLETVAQGGEEVWRAQSPQGW